MKSEPRSNTTSRTARRIRTTPVRLEPLEERLPPGDAWLSNLLGGLLLDAPVLAGVSRASLGISPAARESLLAGLDSGREQGQLSLLSSESASPLLVQDSGPIVASAVPVAPGALDRLLSGFAQTPARQTRPQVSAIPNAPTGGATGAGLLVVSPGMTGGTTGTPAATPADDTQERLDTAVQNLVEEGSEKSTETRSAPIPPPVSTPTFAAPAGGQAAAAEVKAEPDFFQYMTPHMRENHGMYDNLYTAKYEAWLLGQPFQSEGGGGGSIQEYGADVRMSTPPFNGNQNEFQIDINPTDTRFAIGSSNSGRSAGVGIYRTSDGGQTWIASDPPGVSGCCDPAIVYGSDGVAYLGILGGGGQITLRTENNGETWERVGTPQLEDRNNIAVDPRDSNVVYVTYSQLGGADSRRIKGYRSTDGGRTWGANFFVGAERPPDGYQQSSQPRVASDGRLYVGYQQYINSSQGCAAGTQNVVGRSDDGGQTWSHFTWDIRQGGACTPGQVGRGIFCINSGGSNFRSRSHPILSVHPTNPDIVYLVYSGGDLDSPYTCAGSAGFHSDTLFRKSVDGGKTFSDPIAINTDGQGFDQYYPWMDVSPNGRIWVGWNDRRNDPQNFRSRWYQAYSDDQGATWTEEMVADVDTQPSTFIGDYHGLAAENDRVLGMWFDSRANPSGDPFTDPNFQFSIAVRTTDPARGSIVSAPLTQFTVTFTHAYDPATVDASDLTVNDIPADTVEQTDPQTLTFRYTVSPMTAEGTQTIAMAEGALLRAEDGSPLLPFSTTFRYDTVRLAVAATDPAAGSAVALPFTSLRVAFNEPIDPATVGTNDLTLTQGTVTAAVVLDKRTVEYTLSGVTVEGSVVARMAAGALADAFGNPSVPFDGTYFTDIGVVPFSTPLRAREPRGSLVYETTATGLLGPADDFDYFTLRADPRQTLSVVVTPTQPTLRPAASLYAITAKGEAIYLADAVAGTPGQAVVIPAVRTPDEFAGDPPGPLDYVVTVGGDGTTTGTYRVRVTLNADHELEAHNGPTNDTRKTAQSLDGALQSLLYGAAEPTRAAVVGTTDPASRFDYYAFTLPQWEVATLALSGLTSPNVNLQLVDANDNVLAAGDRTATNATELIQYIVGTGEPLYARVRGGAGLEYNLLLTRNTEFEREGNNSYWQGQILPTGRALGRVGGTPATGSDPSGPVTLPININDGTAFRWDIQTNGSISDGTNDAYDGGLVHRNFNGATTGESEDNRREIVIGPLTTGGARVTRKIFVPADQGYSRFLEIVTNPGTSTLNYTVFIDTNLGSDSGTILVGTSSGDTVFNTEDDWIVTDDTDGTGDPTLLHVTSGPGARLRAAVAALSVDSLRYEYRLTLNPGETQIVMHFASQNTNRATALAKGPQLTTLGIGALAGMTGEELEAVVNFDLGDPTDFYQADAGEGTVLTLRTSTPGDLDGEHNNRLDPMVRLYNGAGELVASDDNSGADGRNALLTYTVPTGGAGTYYIEVVPSDQTAPPTVGEYVLELEQASSSPLPGGPARPAFDPLALSPAADQPLATLGSEPGTGAGAEGREAVAVPVPVSTADLDRFFSLVDARFVSLRAGRPLLGANFFSLEGLADW